MGNHIGYLWAVATIVWGGTMFYVISMYRKQVRVQKELEGLHRTLEEELRRK